MFFLGVTVLGSLVAGSFLTVVTENEDGISWIKRKRSWCSKCGHLLAPKDLLPVFSHIFLRGRCRYCGEKIAPHHFFTETGTLFLGLLVYFFSPRPLGWEFVFLAVFMFCLFALTLTDLKFWTLPDSFVIFFALTGMVRAFVLREPKIADALIGLILGAAALGSIALFSGGKAMGWGDVKLSGAMGLVLGWQQLILALALAFIIGGIIGAFLIVFKKSTMKSMVPFGPFLTAATAMLLLFPGLYKAVLLFYGLV